MITWGASCAGPLERSVLLRHRHAFLVSQVGVSVENTRLESCNLQVREQLYIHKIT
jgi:hypothetical protein